MSTEPAQRGDDRRCDLDCITREEACPHPDCPAPMHPIQRESVEDALENDRCGICLSVDHFREDCPEASR